MTRGGNPPSREQRPLRRVTQRACVVGTRRVDLLECGHLEPVRGNTRYTDATRRRCSTCPPVLPQEKP